jgi:hypothetical protein
MKSLSGNRYAEVLDALPEETKIPDLPYNVHLLPRYLRPLLKYATVVGAPLAETY